MAGALPVKIGMASPTSLTSAHLLAQHPRAGMGRRPRRATAGLIFYCAPMFTASVTELEKRTNETLLSVFDSSTRWPARAR